MQDLSPALSGAVNVRGFLPAQNATLLDPTPSFLFATPSFLFVIYSVQAFAVHEKQ
jgi:hypothetical protein